MATTMGIEGSDEEALRKLATGGSIDYSTWPMLLSIVTSRIEKIAHNDFPIPRIPPPIAVAPPLQQEPRFLVPLPPSSDPASSSPPHENETTTVAAGGSGNNSTASSQQTDKENAAPTDQMTTTEAPAPLSASDTAPDSASAPVPPVAELEPGALPPQIMSMIAEITGVLNETFHTYPPHTIQRLAELVLEPRRHYKSLPAYLHAVDRVVHVTSGNNIYPLPPSIPDMRHMHINGAASDDRENSAGAGEDDTLAIWASSNNGAPIGSDEALGGALLTPIPWLARRVANGDTGSDSGESSTLGSEGQSSSPLAPVTVAAANAQSQQQNRQTTGRGQYEMQVRTESTETIDGPNGMGSIETVSVSINGISSLSVAQQQRVITQGELIRQEQRAGVVPVSQLARGGPLVVTSSSSTTSGSSATAPAGLETDTPMGEGESEAAKDSSSEKSDDEMVDDDEVPHARGPDLIGAADMGPQNPTSSTFSISSGGNVEVRGIDVEAAVGRKHEAQMPSSAEPEAASQSESSDDGVVLTPASSAVVESATPAEHGSSEKQEGDDDDDDAKESEPTTSATLSARSSPAPGKRGAEDDIAESEPTSSKRLKGSPKEEDDNEPPLEGGPTTEAGSSDAGPAASEGAQVNGPPEAQPEAVHEDVTKDAEGDVVPTNDAPPSASGGNDEEAPPPPVADDTGTDKLGGDGDAPEAEKVATDQTEQNGIVEESKSTEMAD